MMLCDDFVCKHGDTCINEPVCELKCGRFASVHGDACKICIYELACHRPRRNKIEYSLGVKMKKVGGSYVR